MSQHSVAQQLARKYTEFDLAMMLIIEQEKTANLEKRLVDMRFDEAEREALRNEQS